MPVVLAPLHAREDVGSNSTDPGQRVSIDGGIDSKRNIIAMILATGKRYKFRKPSSQSLTTCAKSSLHRRCGLVPILLHRDGQARAGTATS